MTLKRSHGKEKLQIDVMVNNQVSFCLKLHADHLHCTIAIDSSLVYQLMLFNSPHSTESSALFCYSPLSPVRCLKMLLATAKEK